jgi:DNA-binding transcriptional MerR regulator
MLYSMKQTCQKVGMTYEALKFYCNQGLVPNVKRDKNNYRVFDERDIEWIHGLTCLKRCGMSLSDMKLYLALCLKGQATIPERKEILEKQRNTLKREMKRLQEDIAYIDWKQAYYDDVMAGKIQYTSNLIEVE